MYLVFIFNMPVLLVFGLFVVIATAHNITFLEVPRYGDPHHEASLVCHYVSEQGDPALHSVKWYRGRDEIFRFMPGQQPTTRTFNSTAGSVSKGTCNLNSCSISVVLPRSYNAKLSFTCEVSTEGPRFAVVKQTKNLTIAVTLKENPVIIGVPGTVQLGEDILLNCTTQPAMPPANIMWYIDGRPETEPWFVNNTQVSTANDFGLRSSWRSLKLRVATTRTYMALRCEATQPTFPPYTRTTNKTLQIAKSPHLSMFTAAGSSSTLSESTVLMLTSYVATEPWFVQNTEVSTANDFGLRSSWRSLKLRVATTRTYRAFRCEVTEPTFLPYTRTTNKSLENAKSPHLSMFTAPGSSSTLSEATVLMLTSYVAVRIFSKCSALSEV